MSNHPFRFGVMSAYARSGEEWMERARRVESLGYATLMIPDNIQHTLAPFPALAMTAAATHTLRVGTYVFANDYRNPVMLAKDAATLDFLSGGRFELGIGAGRPTAEADNRMLGISFDSGGVRLARMAESVTIIKALLAGEPVTHTGKHYTVTNAQITPGPVQKPRPPILVAGAGPRLLALAAREADIIALGIAPDAREEAVAEKIAAVRAAAGDRYEQIELNIQLMAVNGQVPRWIAANFGANLATWAHSTAVPVVTGTPDEICDQLQRRRESLGISYILCSDELMEALAPVVERLAGR